MLLKTKNLMKAFGGLKAINKVDFELPAGEIRGIIGPNGSGKSTFFNLVSGVYDPDPGSYIEFDGHDITNEPPHKIGALGLSRTFQLLSCLLYTSPSPRDGRISRMPSSA